MHVIHENQSVARKWTKVNDLRGMLSLEIKGGTISKFNNCFAVFIFKILKCP